MKKVGKNHINELFVNELSLYMYCTNQEPKIVIYGMYTQISVVRLNKLRCLIILSCM